MPEVAGASRRINVFFYGLFMDAEYLRAKGIQAMNARIAFVDGFALHIGQRATLLPRKDSSVYGVIMELTHLEIEQLYAEPSVSAYRPEAVIVNLADGLRVPALCFNLSETSNHERPNPDYASRLRDLGHRLGLPSTYVEKIR